MPEKNLGWPWTEQNIWIENKLQDKAVHVMVLPNEDYVFAEILVSFAGIGLVSS